MAIEIPLGREEDDLLEFKSREALETPEIIGREVVAMLNAKGGEIWIGLRDENHRAVAVEPISDPEAEKRRLLNSLLDSIQPPIHGEMDIRGVEGDTGSILQIRVAPQDNRRPYALMKRGGWHFLRRVGDRVVPMTREDIARLFMGANSSQESRQEQAFAKVLAARNELQRRREEIFCLRIEPTVELDIDLHDRQLEELLHDPRISGNRSAGWSFTEFQCRPEIRQGRLRVEDILSLEIRRDGGLTFTTPLSSLHWKGEEQEIWPFALLELPISAFRVAREVYRTQPKLGPEAGVVADLILVGLKGWKLRYGSPGRWSARSLKTFLETDDFFLDRPLLFQGNEIETEPDRCGYRLVERIYEAFGYRRDAIPQEFNQETGRLVLPE
ncbi:MAG TPA: ATP-binding protein [Thermoanaerobaculia bacterium]|nr:ATP-binding protein [Thermoanaerobaculia bacterium]